MSETSTFAPATIKAAALVGRVVTYGNRQYKIHCIEATDWYAFQDGDKITIDSGMTAAEWIKEPVATLVPSGHVIGDGFALADVPLGSPFLSLGVCLAKW